LDIADRKLSMRFSNTFPWEIERLEINSTRFAGHDTRLECVALVWTYVFDVRAVSAQDVLFIIS